MPPAKPMSLFVPLLLALTACSVLALTACAGAASHTRLADPETLLAERDEWRGERSGPVMLRLHIEALVDARPDPDNARSSLNVHLVAAHFGAAQPIPVTFPLPRGARLAGSELRLVTPGANRPAALAAPLTTTKDGLDPDQDSVTVTLPAPPADGLVEAILRFEVPGTLVSDARWVGLPGLPIGELFLRYDVTNESAVGFQTTHAARPVVTDQDGRTLIALLVQNVPPLMDPRTTAYARYVTMRVAPLGVDQRHAGDWAEATAAYRAGVVEAADGVDDGFEVPYRPVGTGRAQLLDAFAWVRARPMRADPFAARWDAARPLPAAIRDNDLSAVDRVHLLHWILREAGIAHDYVMARAAYRPPLDPTLPAPGVFDAPLIQAAGLVLDPACDACAPGEVRESLRGGQALVIPVAPGTKEAAFIALPTQSPSR